ncbi:MAG: ABC transporter ATP-binding protein [Clostridia bacterium]|nr:ABC transporter ATP-binding protein [Clostridia bacterium]
MKLTAEQASFSYRNGEPVIRDLNFTAESGEVTAILGPNGAGKTTLIKCLMGFLRWTTGRSLLDGRDVRTIPEKEFLSRVSYVPQAKGSRLSITAEEMILLGVTGRIGVFSTPGKAEREFVRSLADSLGIAGLLPKKCTEMSGGEGQMVLIARALAAKPALLVLDEPESNLDFRNQLIVLETLTRLAKEGMAVIFNTHYPEHALTRASKALLLAKNGETVCGPVDEVVTEDNIRSAFGVEASIREFDGGQKGILPLRLTKESSI